MLKLKCKCDWMGKKGILFESMCVVLFLSISFLVVRTWVCSSRVPDSTMHFVTISNVLCQGLLRFRANSVLFRICYLLFWQNKKAIRQPTNML